MLLTNGDGCLGWPVCPPGLNLRFSSECGPVLLLFGWHFEVRLYAATVSEVSNVALRGLREPRIRGLLLRNKRYKVATPNTAYVCKRVRVYEGFGSKLGGYGEDEPD